VPDVTSTSLPLPTVEARVIDALDPRAEVGREAKEERRAARLRAVVGIGHAVPSDRCPPRCPRSSRSPRAAEVLRSSRVVSRRCRAVAPVVEYEFTSYQPW